MFYPPNKLRVLSHEDSRTTHENICFEIVYFAYYVVWVSSLI